MDTLNALTMLLREPTPELIASLRGLCDAIADDAVVCPATFRDLQRLSVRMQQDELPVVRRRYADAFGAASSARAVLLALRRAGQKGEAAGLLAEKTELFERLAAELRKRGSAYWVIFEALLSLAESARIAAPGRTARIADAGTGRTL
jgi:nitrate reductase assembly molybdenum cofactor insertion protein NarJ